MIFFYYHNIKTDNNETILFARFSFVLIWEEGRGDFYVYF